MPMKACLPQFHPLEPFFPQGAKLLMLGSFPPKTNRWSMDFFNPNFQNDMWRIFGLLYYSNPLHFAIAGKKAFDKDKLIEFLSARRIALYDTAVSVVRLKDNASDAFLDIKETVDIDSAMEQLPECTAIATTGKKACQVLASIINAKEPPMGESTQVRIGKRRINFYRMVSTSRAYPMTLQKKADIYANMLRKEDLL